VQLYEAIAMLLFLAAFLVLLRAGIRIATHAGFHFFIGTYTAHRFLWEFIKPYGTIFGPLNLFHLICLGLLGYAWSYGRAELRHG
jgi:phosphatidylglycerol---prolipoprotein diacylglyceryl transferase